MKYFFGALFVLSVILETIVLYAFINHKIDLIPFMMLITSNLCVTLVAIFNLKKYYQIQKRD